VALAAGGAPAALAASAAAARPPCSQLDPGGAWPSYGHDAANTRAQSAEANLGPAEAARLAKRWVFTTQGGIQSTPVVSGGCVYVTTTTGNVYAVDAKTGRPAWHRTVTFSGTSGGTSLGGVIPGAPAVVGDQLIALVSQNGAPYAESFDAHTGNPIWRSAPVSTQKNAYTNASAAVSNGVLVFGYSPPEGADAGQGGVALLDANSGAVLADVPTVPVADQRSGFSGGGIWSTAAFDDNGYAYVGAGNPNSKTKQHPHTDAILKIDINRHRATFGHIVGYARGNVDQYSDSLQTLSRTPVCGASDTGQPWPLDDPLCGQLDLDFGASPNLFPDGAGGQLVGDLQKSGEYHVAHAATMSPDWSSTVGLSCVACNAASTAYDGSAIYTVGTPGGVLWALNPTTGTTKWESPVADGLHYQSISTADGVVYTVDMWGFLDAWNAADGSVVLKHSAAVDARTPAGGFSSQGVAIADHTVFTSVSSIAAWLDGSSSASPPTGGYLVAYTAG
jgi:polyvinyl alcohol dehydrogenase (cytochrome)